MQSIAKQVATAIDVITYLFFLVLISNQTFKYIVIKILITALSEKDASFCNSVYSFNVTQNFVLFLE